MSAPGTPAATGPRGLGTLVRERTLRRPLVAGAVAVIVPPAIIALAELNVAVFVGYLPIFAVAVGVPQLVYVLVASTRAYASSSTPRKVLTAVGVWAVVGAGAGLLISFYDFRTLTKALLGAGTAVIVLSASTLVATALVEPGARATRVVVLSVVAAAVFITVLLMLPNY